MEVSMCKCARVGDITKAEIQVIKKHLDRHKWFHHFTDENDAVADFVWKYAWIMREVFCGKLCTASPWCDAGKVFRSAFLHDISDGELNVFIKECCGDKPRDLSWLQLQVIKHHISMHKWFHRIDNYKDAVRDFLDKFGWVIDEMYEATRKKLTKRRTRD
jgi:hypothetical protein